jgi:hypothetical protein
VKQINSCAPIVHFTNNQLVITLIGTIANNFHLIIYLMAYIYKYTNNFNTYGTAANLEWNKVYDICHHCKCLPWLIDHITVNACNNCSIIYHITVNACNNCSIIYHITVNACNACCIIYHITVNACNACCIIYNITVNACNDWFIIYPISLSADNCNLPNDIKIYPAIYLMISRYIQQFTLRYQDLSSHIYSISANA